MNLTPAQQRVRDEMDRLIASVHEGQAIQFPSELLWSTADNMQATAGSFVRLLGELFLRADGHNQKLIVQTWPNYFLQYAQ